MALVRRRTIPTERPLLVVRGCHVVSVADPQGRILGFVNRSRYFFFQVAPSCTHEAEWTPFQSHTGNRTRDSGSIASNSYHWATETVTPSDITVSEQRQRDGPVLRAAPEGVGWGGALPHLQSVAPLEAVASVRHRRVQKETLRLLTCTQHSVPAQRESQEMHPTL
jgi:hypothetical protein